MTLEMMIKREVENRGMKLRFLSDKANVAYGCLRSSLSGRRSLRADEYLRICAVLQIDPKMPDEKGA